MSIKQGDYLKELRVKNKLSQEKLAEKLGLSRQSISKWEQGYALPDTDNLLKLSELYGISVDTLLKCGEAEKKEAPEEENKTETDTDRSETRAETKTEIIVIERPEFKEKSLIKTEAGFLYHIPYLQRLPMFL